MAPENSQAVIERLATGLADLFGEWMLPAYRRQSPGLHSDDRLLDAIYALEAEARRHGLLTEVLSRAAEIEAEHERQRSAIDGVG